MKAKDIPQEIKNGIKLFQYLEELSLLNLNIRGNIKKLSADEDFFDIESPEFLPMLDKIFLRTKKEATNDDDLLMSLERYEIEKMPKLPKELEDWVDISIQSFNKPELKKHRVVSENFKDSKERMKFFDEIADLTEVPEVLKDWVTKDRRFGRAKYKIIENRDEKIFLKDFPELESLYDGWIENKWTAWRDKNYQYLLANSAYDKFYALRSFLKTEIDNFDLLWAHDIFTWKKNGNEIYHPTFFTPTVLEFDPEKNIILLKRDQNKKLIFDVSFIREALDESNTNLAEIDELSEKINSDPNFDVWNFDMLNRYLGGLSRLVSPDGISKYNKRDEIIEVESNPIIYNYHGIYLLKKNGKSWAEYSKKIQEDIITNNELTPFLNDLVGTSESVVMDVDVADEDEDDSGNNKQDNESLPHDTELYFPLPYNEEQKIIARQIESSYGSVVQGPPGTGKTHTIANLISRFLAQGKTVLVTSQKGQALSVLKSKIPKEIRNLVVSQVEESAKDGDLQLAVREINSNLSDSTNFTEAKKIKKIKELGEKRREIAQKNNEFQKKSLLDSREEIILDVEKISPITAAKYIADFDNTDTFKLEDDIDYSQDATISQSNIDDYISILENSDPKTWKYSELEKIPEVKSLPDISIINRFFELRKELKEEELDLFNKYVPSLSELSVLDNFREYAENYLVHSEKSEIFKKTVKQNIDIVTDDTFEEIVTSLNENKISTIKNALAKAKEKLLLIKEPWEKELFINAQNKNEHDKWLHLIRTLEAKITEYRAFDRILVGNNIFVSRTYEADVLFILSLIDKLCQQALQNGGKVKKGLSILFSSDTKKFLESVQLNSRGILTIDDLHIVKAYFSLQKIQEEFHSLWLQGFRESKKVKDFPDPFRIINLETSVLRMRDLITFREENEELSNSILGLDFIDSFDIVDTTSLSETWDIFDNLISYIRLREYADMFTNVRDTFSVDNPHKLVVELKKCIDRKEFDSIMEIKDKLILINDRKKLCLEYFDLKEEVFCESVKELQQSSRNQKDVAEFLTNLETSSDIDKISNFYLQIPDLISEQNKSNELASLTAKLKEIVPKTATLIKSKIKLGDSVVIDLPKNFKWKKLISWLDYLHDGDSISKISKDLHILKNQEKDLIKDLIEIGSWIHLKNRVSKEQREALSAFALSMRQYGMGSGKYASTHMRNARAALEIGKGAVPVWIMPMNMIHQLFPNPKAGMFDVVIFDEASQVDTRGLNIAYLGKKLLVVGDDEQVSPTSFTQQSVVADLIARHMSEIPNSVHFSTTSSLFDIAKIKMTDIVTLTEHFRCIEELIGFSNTLSYSGRLKILRDQLPKDRLDPVLEPIFIQNGYEETNGQVNQPEAERIVEELQKMLSDEKYKETIEDGITRPVTFGVISLLGKDQSKYITKLISEKISSKEIEKRGIICGDPYIFQGDERDIILISMVKGCDQENPDANIMPYTINKKENKQRTNVAMSRARNKMILFHSIPKDKLQNPDDLRKMIIDWFYNHKTEERKAGLQRIREEVERGRASEFEYEVAEILINKGYKVIPQWEVAGYRIDLVVQGENSKLAIECDGDKYHNAIEKWQEDIDRQQILERSGWKFWRLTGSSFYRHKEKALDSLWTKLEELKINPQT
jgi:very-short-patch-repair endonuclease